jgi:predicted nucleotidyltransferase
MTIISHNLTGKIDKKTVTLLSEIDTIALDLKLAFFIVGATARDILLQHAHGIYTTRATLDVDIGVFFSDWEQLVSIFSKRRTLITIDHRLVFWDAKWQEWPARQPKPSWSAYWRGRLSHRKATKLRWMS